MDDLISTGEASRLAGVSQVTINNWIRRGEISPATKVQHMNLLRRQDVIAVAERKGLPVFEVIRREATKHG